MTERDEGLSLVEILVAVAILVLVSAAAATAFSAFLQNYEVTNERYAASNDTEAAAAYFANDTQSAADLLSQVCDQTGVVNVSQSTYNRVITFTSTDTASVNAAADTVVVSYVTPKTGDPALERTQCLNGSFRDRTVVVGQLNPTVSPSVVCAPVSTCATGSSFTAVTMTVTTTDGHSAQLRGQKRKSS